ncbi:TPA: penicillin-binding protein 1C, partial [Legionella pneumophila]|nr:penicillin-binding protein 1C [Legionella pneumophila]
DKDKILEAYFNLAPYGGNIEGAGAASLIYFNKPVRKLGLPEALTLSIIPQNPVKRTSKNSELKKIRNHLFARWLKQHPEDKEKQSLFGLPLVMQTNQNLPFHAP